MAAPNAKEIADPVSNNSEGLRTRSLKLETLPGVRDRKRMRLGKRSGLLVRDSNTLAGGDGDQDYHIRRVQSRCYRVRYCRSGGRSEEMDIGRDRRDSRGQQIFRG